MACNFVKKETPVQVYFDIWGYFFLQKTCFLWFHFLCCCLYLITLQAWRPESLLKALVNIAKCLRTALLKDYLWISESRRQLLQWLLSEEYRTVECSRYIYIYIYIWTLITLHNKWIFLLKISSVNVTIGHFY